VHLLTKEAFEVYQRHLNTNGIIAVHISNHYLDLEPVVVNVARHFGYKLASMITRKAMTPGGFTPRPGCCCRAASTSSTPPPSAVPPASSRPNNIKVPLWTDDFASLFQILR